MSIIESFIIEAAFDRCVICERPFEAVRAEPLCGGCQEREARMFESRYVAVAGVLRLFGSVGEGA